jgi:tetratricopeptide (TPR) repeat protein
MPAGIKFRSERATVLLAGAAIVLGGIAAYAGSLSGAMIYDDIPAIVENPTIRHLWPLGKVLATPADGASTASGRPVLNLTFALNYAASGTGVWSYHALNLAIHLLAGLALFGIVRRTLKRMRADGPCLPATILAFAVALLWTVHPLQTEAVTYIVQRAESLMGLFYLLTLYCFIRGTDDGEGGDGRPARPSPVVWFGLSFLACLFGMATKEVTATAPLMVFLYDRIFVAGSFAEAWRRRKGVHAALAATWIPLALLVASTGGNRGGSIGFGIAVKWWAYWLTQFEAVARYLWLSLWPHPLVFEYGPFWIDRVSAVLPYALPVLVLLAATVWALFAPARPGSPLDRCLGGQAGVRAAGFLGAWFFGILAPSSLMPGTSQMIVEHRMYLSLAAAVTAVVLGIYAAVGSIRSCLWVCLALAVGYGAMTWRRNEIYRSGLTLWSDTLAKRPNNPVADFNLGTALFDVHRDPEALEHFQRAVRIRPDMAVTHYNLGYELYVLGRVPEAVAQFEEALRLSPSYAAAHINLGVALVALGRPADAIAHYEEALRLKPDLAQAHDNYGNALLLMGRLPEAADQYAQAVQLDPYSSRAQANLGSALLQLGRFPEAASHLAAAVDLDPGLAETRAKLGDALMEIHRPEDAISQYEETLRRAPDNIQVQNNLGIALAATGRLQDAIGHYEEAIRLDPGLADAHYNLGNVLLRLGRASEAAGQYEQVLRIKPDDAGARARLERARQAAANGKTP